MTDSDHDICHDFEDNILENSRDSIEVDDEISINPTDFAEKITRSPKDAHLKPERWKYKTRKKRKKSQGNAGDEILDDESEKRVENENIECSSVENSVDLDLIKTKYAKMSKTAKQSDYGKELYNILNCKNKSTGLDSAGNSEHQSSSDDAIRKPIPTWKDKTVECEVCGKEMLRSRLKKHVKIAHKSKKLYPCDECSFNAENLIELKKHLRKRHKLSTGTVRKMVKLMKMNRKHRRSVLEDDLEDVPLARRRLLTSPVLGTTITDELHQTDSGSEMERRTRGAARTNYKELSFDDEDWKLALGETDSDEDDEDESMEEDKEEVEVEKDEESADSGRETQTATELSSDEKTSEEVAAEELLASMRTLGEEERANPGERYYSKEQRELLWSYYHINQFPSTEHREILGQKVGVGQRKVYFWFDNSRRIGKNKTAKVAVAPVNIVEREKRVRRPRATTPDFAASKVVSNEAAPKAGTVIEYDVSKITRSSRTLEETVEAGEPICLGVDITPTNCRCLLCSYTCSFRGNLYKHLRSHGFEPKFCALPREQSTLGADMKGCRKTFTVDTFDLHTCNDEPPTCFGDEVKLDKRFKAGETTNGSNSSGESDEEGEETGIEIVETLRKEGKAVCLGYEAADGYTKCCLCEVRAATRGNLYKHINVHGYTTKFCCNPRENSELEDGTRGCRKIFLEETFDKHRCTAQPPEQLGNFPLDRNKKSKKPKRGGFRGFEKNFGTPDGSPAKFYNDRYTRLYHQLAIRTNVGLPMDSTFVRNGKMELCYLSDRQMSAVKDYLDDNDKYILVRLSGYNTLEYSVIFTFNNLIPVILLLIVERSLMLFSLETSRGSHLHGVSRYGGLQPSGRGGELGVLPRLWAECPPQLPGLLH